MNEQEIFEAVVELAEPAQRQAFLARTCGDNAALRARVEALLAAHAAASNEFLPGTAKEQTPSTASDQQPTLEFPGSEEGVGTERRADRENGEFNGPPDLSFLQPSAKPGSLGRLGHYEMLQVLGQGAFGIVFKAFDEKLHRLVAIKAMSPELAATSPPRKRFLREARSVAALKHENIVQIYSVEEQPLPYLAMEFVDGPTLQQKLDRSGPLEIPEILHLGRQVAAGLAAAHEKGLIHRDIKPGNILLEAGAEPKVKITDFGLARAADDASMSRTGTIAGTPMYMAPEQALGQTLDHRADLFSLGSVLYQMTCGRPPFRGANAMAVLKRVVDETPRPIQDILPQAPDWLCAIIEKLHAKSPDQRYQSAQEVVDVLARCQHELPISVQVTSAPKRRETLAANSPSRAPLVAVVAAAATLLVVSLSVTELAGITHLFRKSSDNWSGVNKGAPVDQQGFRVEPKQVAGRTGGPADAPPPAIAPFDAPEAQAHQAAWARYLGVPVEFTNSIGMKFRLIPPGEFTMGMTKVEADAVAALAPAEEPLSAMSLSSAPEHRVRLTLAYYLSACEVTQAQYEQVMSLNPAYFSAGGEGQAEVAGQDTRQFPVETVSFIDAAEFCIQLSKQENIAPLYESDSGEGVRLLPGDGYRLPTEAEWEFACRAGTSTAWFSGEHEGTLATVAWFTENSGGMTHPVGLLQANPFGLYDLYGNVWEWCQDWYDPLAYANRGAGLTIDPSDDEASSLRTLRGGYWASGSAYCRSDLRGFAAPTFSRYDGGFRVLAGVDTIRKAWKLRESKLAPSPEP